MLIEHDNFSVAINLARLLLLRLSLQKSQKNPQRFKQIKNFVFIQKSVPFVVVYYTTNKPTRKLFHIFLEIQRARVFC